jgi:hypothetical protein
MFGIVKKVIVYGLAAVGACCVTGAVLEAYAERNISSEYDDPFGTYGVGCECDCTSNSNAKAEIDILETLRNTFACGTMSVEEYNVRKEILSEKLDNNLADDKVVKNLRFIFASGIIPEERYREVLTEFMEEKK